MEQQKTAILKSVVHDVTCVWDSKGESSKSACEYDKISKDIAQFSADKLKINGKARIRDVEMHVHFLHKLNNLSEKDDETRRQAFIETTEEQVEALDSVQCFRKLKQLC